MNTPCGKPQGTVAGEKAAIYRSIRNKKKERPAGKPQGERNKRE